MDSLNNELEDGTIVCVTRSNEELADEFPERAGVTRSFMHIGGWVLQPVDKEHTLATLMFEVDLNNNWIPEFGVKEAYKMQGYQIERIR